MNAIANFIFTLFALSGIDGNADMDAWLNELERVRSAGHEHIFPEEDAAGAVDGQVSGLFDFHTDEEKSPFWQVDLGEQYALGYVALFNIHMPERAASFLLLISEDGNYWREVYQHDDSPPVGEEAGQPFIVPLNNQQARFVRIQLPGNGHLHLTEVQVYSEDGSTNLALGKAATQSSVSQWSTRSIEINTEEWSDEELVQRVFNTKFTMPGSFHHELKESFNGLINDDVPITDTRWADLYVRATNLQQRITYAREGLAHFNVNAFRRAVEDLASEHPEQYAESDDILRRITNVEIRLPEITAMLTAGDYEALVEAENILQFHREVLMSNPLLDFDRIVFLQRGFSYKNAARTAIGAGIGMPANWQSGIPVPRRGHWQDRLAVLSDLRGETKIETLFEPEEGRTLSDPVLGFDADSILFTMEGMSEHNWRIFEFTVDGAVLRQITPDDGDDVGHFDPCYLPDGNILFTSTAGFMGLPCVFGSDPMVCIYRLNSETGDIRQLTFEQDSNWNPTPLPNGRVLYQRWEYSDIPHSNSRLLFHMNPDGTDQREFYGSGSYFPASFFYARPVPDHPRMVIGVATGHHGNHRSGRLLLIDPALGRHEATGVVQEIPGYGKTVEPIVRDRLADDVWPQFLHPYPLSSKYHLVSAKLSPDSLWGIYLVDIFDNILLIQELEGDALLWPIPMKKTLRPPVVHDRVDLNRSDGTMLITDIYEGDGLKGIPRGTVAALRIFEYYFSYRGFGGLLGSIGMDGPWDIRRVLGIVPVEPDGSAYFSVPANTPISIQALDEKGQALQIMRSWTVAMPGEKVSCIGCHESQNQSPPIGMPAAILREPSPVHATWQEPVRGFNFDREVQPVLDRHCLGCHDGSVQHEGIDIPYLGGDRKITDWSSALSGSTQIYMTEEGDAFSEAYANLHRFVRRPGIESDLRMLSPMEYHFSTTELGQMLRKGHHGVHLDAASWDRLVTWFDLNAPYHGTWHEIVGSQRAEQLYAMQSRANALREKYIPQGPIPDYEHIPDLPDFQSEFINQEHNEIVYSSPPTITGWPFDADTAKQMQQAAAIDAGLEDSPEKTIHLGQGPVFPAAYLGHDDTRESIDVGPVNLELVLVPGGRFVLGASDGHPDESPYTEVEVEPFYMAKFEITNAQYRMFNPHHESRDESRHGYQFGRRGFYQDAPGQPVIRVSWEEAREFCSWLSEKTGIAFDLPTEAQWEWAARAGADTPFYFGAVDSDYSTYANLADRTLREFVQDTALGNYTHSVIIENPNRYDDWIPRCDTYTDNGLVTVDVGQYCPNFWGLFDMHGNAAEWTRSAYLPYPYREDDGRNDTQVRDVERVVRGGSWRDRPHQSTASYRRPYQPYQRVYNVGFRVVAPVDSVQ